MIQMETTISDQDLVTISEIWLTANQDTHDFIPVAYWLKHRDSVKSALRTAEIYTYRKNGRIVGFIGLVDQLVAGIFVQKEYRSLGIGKYLLDEVKEHHDFLTLAVYSKNTRAIAFYLAQGFIVIEEKEDVDMNERELIMQWEDKD